MSLPDAVERVVGVELPGHGRVGDLLHADGDVHAVAPVARACRARRSIGRAWLMAVILAAMRGRTEWRNGAVPSTP